MNIARVPRKSLSDRNWDMQTCSQIVSMSSTDAPVQASHHVSLRLNCELLLSPQLRNVWQLWWSSQCLEILSRSVEIVKLFVYLLLISYSAILTMTFNDYHHHHQPTIFTVVFQIRVIINQKIMIMSVGGRPNVSENDGWCNRTGWATR